VAGAGAEGAVRLGEQRRRAAGEQPHMGAGLAGEAGMLEQARIERRHAHHGGRLRQQPQHLVGIELLQEDHRAARDHHGIGGGEQAVRVIERQRVKEHVLVGETPALHQHLRVGGEIAVAEHRALGAAGGSRGVEDGGEVGLGAGDVGEPGGRAHGGLDQRALAAGIERVEGGDAVALRHRREAVAPGRIAHHQGRLGVADEIVELRQRIGAVERQIDRARPQRREIEHQVFGRLLHLHGHAVAGLHAALAQHIGEAARHRQHVRIGDGAPMRLDDQRLARGGDTTADEIEKIAAHGRGCSGIGSRSYSATLARAREGRASLRMALAAMTVRVSA
jgi:hypothetical protein